MADAHSNIIPPGFVPVVAAEQSSGVSQPPPTPVDHTNSQDSLRASALPDGYVL